MSQKTGNLLNDLNLEPVAGYEEWAIQKIQDALIYNKAHSAQALSYDAVRAKFALDED